MEVVRTSRTRPGGSLFVAVLPGHVLGVLGATSFVGSQAEWFVVIISKGFLLMGDLFSCVVLGPSA